MSAAAGLRHAVQPHDERMGQQGQQPWVLVTELKKDFTSSSVP